MTAGLVVAASGSAALARIGPVTSYGVILIGLLLIPAGIGVTVPVMTASLLDSVPRPRAGVASGALNAVRQTGGTIGVALFGGLSAQGAFVSAAVLLFVAAVIAGWVIRSAEQAQHPAGAPAGASPISR